MDSNFAREVTVGDTVKLKAGVVANCPPGRENNATAKVEMLLQGGELFMGRDLHGCRYWGQNDVELVAESEHG